DSIKPTVASRSSRFAARSPRCSLRTTTSGTCLSSCVRACRSSSRTDFAGAADPRGMWIDTWCDDRAVPHPDAMQRRLAIASQTFAFIETEIRPFLASGGRMWSKGSLGFPRRVRKMLERLDSTQPVTFATLDAMRLELSERVIEHVVPMKRIVIEIVDPSQADPRSNSRTDPIAGGPATSPEHLISIFDRLLEKCWVTEEEH